jgi:hypothetical protein
MPDFSLIQPLVVTNDQRSEAFNMGVGNANPSQLGSFLEGFQQSARDWTVTRNLQLESQTKYDPDRIAAERLRQDLENKSLEEAIYQSSVKSKYAERNAQLGIEGQEVDILGQRASNRITNKKADLLEKYGEEETLLDLSGKRLRNAGASLSNQQARKQLAEEEDPLKKLEKQASILGKLGPLLKTGGADPLTDSERISVLKQRDSYRNSLAALDAEIADLDKSLSSPKISETSRKRYEEEKKIATKRRGEVQTDFAMLPSLDRGAEVSPQDQKLSQLRQSAVMLADQVMSIDLINAEKEAMKQGALIESQLSKTKDSAATMGLAREYASSALQAKADINPATGSVNFPSFIANLDGIRAAKRKHPEEADFYSGLTTRVLGTKEDVTNVLKDIEAQVKDPEKRLAYQNSVYSSIIESGNVEALQPIQKNLVTLGMGAEELANPDKAIQDISTIISGKGGLVDNEKVLKLRIDPNTMDYIFAATKASKNNTQGFKIIPERVPVAPNALDSSGAQQTSQAALRFVGADGTEDLIPLVTNDKSNAMWQIMEKVSANSAEQAVQYDRTTKIQAQLSQEAAGRIPVQDSSPKPSTLPPPKTKEEAVQRAVARVSEQYQAKTGKAPSAAMIQEFTRRAQAKAAER